MPMWLMQLGEVVYGGVGSGLYGMLAFVIIAVFVAGLMIGRTPEYLGKKIEAFEMKMASLMVLIPILMRLVRHCYRGGIPAAKRRCLTRARTASVRFCMLFLPPATTTAAPSPVSGPIRLL